VKTKRCRRAYAAGQSDWSNQPKHKQSPEFCRIKQKKIGPNFLQIARISNANAAFLDLTQFVSPPAQTKSGEPF
jgi:hypothetical protein